MFKVNKIILICRLWTGFWLLCCIQLQGCLYTLTVGYPYPYLFNNAYNWENSLKNYFEICTKSVSLFPLVLFLSGPCVIRYLIAYPMWGITRFPPTLCRLFSKIFIIYLFNEDYTYLIPQWTNACSNSVQ